MTTSTTGTAPAVPVVGDPVPDHPVLAALAAVDAALASVRETQPTFMTTKQKKQALLATHRIRAQFAELEARLLASSSDVAEADGASDVASWLTHHTQCDLRGTKRDLKLAQALDARYPKVAKAMADGVLSVEHARVIVAVLDALPAVVSLEIRDKAEAELINRSTEFTPDEVRRLGRRILEVVAPEIFEDAEAKKLLEEEQSARKRMRLFFKNTGDGTTRLTGLLPTSEAERLKTYLHAYTSPRHANGEYGEADTIPYSRKLAGAFCALLEHLDPHRLPLHGGDATTLMVTLTLEDLTKDLATAGLLGDKDDISASEARRLACHGGDIVAGAHQGREPAAAPTSQAGGDAARERLVRAVALRPGPGRPGTLGRARGRVPRPRARPLRLPRRRGQRHSSPGRAAPTGHRRSPLVPPRVGPGSRRLAHVPARPARAPTDGRRPLRASRDPGWRRDGVRRTRHRLGSP
ncbi:hypothetical protein HNR19_001592 [Nocardioides thalensis]|uniref:DUF222 domain-containing protein n=1 Tax=Nocardioides thalensis TaxID=1914755 RepID=A0A853C0W3_9ACTN|nr:hypothetical protein [Nocardioides thalensis]